MQKEEVVSLKSELLSFLREKKHEGLEKKMAESLTLKFLRLSPVTLIDSEGFSIEIEALGKEIKTVYEFDERFSYALILKKWQFVFKKVPNSANDYYFDIEAHNYK